MKAFAHPGSETKAPANLNDALATTTVVCRNEYKYVADVETDFGDIPLVPCQLGELNQVFLNLLVNAAHTIGERAEVGGERGVIAIQTRFEDGMAVVRIADSGNGIPPEVREKIFDPFFTTKPVGKGTGQGLTIARSIVVKHGGTLTFETEPGKGSTFEIRLPVPREQAS
jgi:signal transduction histidine kinase